MLALGISALLFGLNFLSIVFKLRHLEYICKPMVILALVFLVYVLHAPVFASVLVVGALFAHLVGDILLMLPRDFIFPAIAFFFLGHIFYIARFALLSPHPSFAYCLVALIIAVIFALGVLPRVLKSLKAKRPRLLLPVILYALILSLLLITAAYSANILAMLGAGMFVASEAVFAQYRFLHQSPNILRPLNISLYHGAQALLVLSLLYHF